VPHLVKTRRRRPKQRKLFEKEHPGDSVQVDVKVVAPGRSKWFQYTAIDDCTRVRVLRLYRRQNHRSSLACLHELTTAFPFQIRQIQVDNGTEFPLLFALTCQDLGVRVRYIRPRRPQQNGKVERSRRIDEEEFWGATPARTSMQPTMPVPPGSIGITTSASRWPCGVGRRWRSWPRSWPAARDSPRCGQRPVSEPADPTC
jgi:transposase InsO family protein